MSRQGDYALKLLESPIQWGLLAANLAWGWKTLDGWQSHLLECKERYIYVNASRQSGKSSLLMVKALWTALVNPRSLVLIVAEQRQSNEDLRRVKDLMYAYNKYLDEQYSGKVTIGLISDNITSIEFGHGSRIIALPGNEKVRGYSAPQLVIIDEASYLDDTVFVGIDPMLEVSKGQLILSSTPNGTSGFFWRENTNPRYYKIKAPWYMCPRIRKESIEEKRLLYGDAYVKQEYEAVFLDDISSLFSQRSLEASLDDKEDAFTEQMENINKVLQGEVELI